MSTGEGVRIVECMYGPRVTHVIRGAYTEEVRTGVWKKFPGMKIEWERNGHHEFVCDLWAVAEKCAAEERRARIIEDSQAAYDLRVEELKKVIWEHIMTMPEWNIGKIVAYVPWEEKNEARQAAILQQIPPEVQLKNLQNLGIIPAGNEN